MALPTTQIFLRSPYFISKETATLDIIVIDLWIYTGTLTTDKTADAQYRLTGQAFVNDDGNFFAEIDIAELARDYVDVVYDFSSTTPSNAVWIEWNLYIANSGSLALTLDSAGVATGLNGYGYFEDGYNPGVSDTVLMSTDYVIVPKGQNATIPILQDYGNGWELYGSNSISPTGLIESFSATATAEESASIIDYVSTAATNPSNVPNFIRLKFTGGRADRDIRIIYLDECEQTATQGAFVNKYGAVQKVYFFGRKSRRFKTTTKSYKRNLLSGTGSYDIKKHETRTLEKNGKTTITVNTGWYPEDSNGVWKEMMLAEKVWLSLSSEYLDFNAFQDLSLTAPVILKTENIKYLEKKYDKLINYTFDMEFAADRINNVR